MDEGLLDQLLSLDLPVAVFDENGQALSNNGASPPAQLMTGESLCVRVLNDLREACNASPIGCVIYQGRGPRPIAIRCTRVQSRNADSVVYLALFLDLNRLPRPKQSVLRQLFGLTPAEARIASELGRGKTIEDIAESSQVSVKTVRTQMRTIFYKTNTHRQAELASLLSRTCILPGSKSKAKIVYGGRLAE